MFKLSSVYTVLIRIKHLSLFVCLFLCALVVVFSQTTTNLKEIVIRRGNSGYGFAMRGVRGEKTYCTN